MSANDPGPIAPNDQEPTRRGFLDTATGALMAGGLVAGYGTFVGIAGRFLYPAKNQVKAWFYVARIEQLQPGDALVYRTPAGARVAVARQGAAGTAEDFIALSSTCPHLGCQVHWEAQNTRFFCPCHNGVFDPQGNGIDGPPKGQALARYPLKVELGQLFIEVPLENLKAEASSSGTLIAHLHRDGSRGPLDPTFGQGAAG